MRRLVLIGLAAAAGVLSTMAIAGTPSAPYGEYPAPDTYPFRRSTLTPRTVIIPPYDHAFRVRVYTTPPQQPFYNVPPYGVITPY